MENELYICPVCGYDKLTMPPYGKEYGDPSYEICSCCGFEFGFDDGSNKITFEVYRKNWVESGFQTFDYKLENSDEEVDEKDVALSPENWSEEVMLKQLENIKKVNYKEWLL